MMYTSMYTEISTTIYCKPRRVSNCDFKAVTKLRSNLLGCKMYT